MVNPFSHATENPDGHSSIQGHAPFMQASLNSIKEKVKLPQPRPRKAEETSTEKKKGFFWKTFSGAKYLVAEEKRGEFKTDSVETSGVIPKTQAYQNLAEVLPPIPVEIPNAPSQIQEQVFSAILGEAVVRLEWPLGFKGLRLIKNQLVGACFSFFRFAVMIVENWECISERDFSSSQRNYTSDNESLVETNKLP